MATASWLDLCLSAVVGFWITRGFYYAYFSPLAKSKLPGPFLARFTNAWELCHFAMSNRTNAIDKAFDRYGPVIRIGTDSVAVNHVEFLKVALGPYSDWRKAHWYKVARFNNTDHAFTIVPFEESNAIRRIYINVLQMTNIVQYQDFLYNLATYQTQRILEQGEHGKKPVGVKMLLRNFSLDAIAQLAFGDDLQITKSGEPHILSEYLSGFPIQNGALTFLPYWFFDRVLRKIPIKAWQVITSCDPNLFAYTGRMLQRTREETKGLSPDAMERHTILSKMLLSGMLPDGNIQAEASANAFAGTDTSTNTMQMLIYEMAINPAIADKLFKELEKHMPDKDSDLPDLIVLNGLEYLNMVIKEALRKWPAVPALLPRLTPKEGYKICGYDIPGDVTIAAQPYSMHRHARVYPNPEKFLPERWLDATPEMNTHFIPFGQGSRMCAGYQYAQVVMRVELANMVHKFKFKLPAGVHPEEVFILQDLFVLLGPKISEQIIFEPRS